MQTKEQFKCPNCGTLNTIEWDKNEMSRNIPCLGCYGEEWEAAKPDEDSKVFDKVKDKMVYTRMLTDAIKHTHGAMLKVIRDSSPDCIIING